MGSLRISLHVCLLFVTKATGVRKVCQFVYWFTSVLLILHDIFVRFSCRSFGSTTVTTFLMFTVSNEDLNEDHRS